VSAKNLLDLGFNIISLAIILITSAEAAEQSCLALRGDGSSYSYRFRTNIPRCEGMYESPVSGDTGMALVSLTLGKVMYDVRQDKYLEIKLPTKSFEKMLIQAVGIPERLYYRLDAELGPERDTLEVPLADVVAPENISPDSIGIYARKRTPEGLDAFVAVSAHSPGVLPQSQIIAIIRPGADVSDVQWRRYPPGETPTAWQPIVGAHGLVPKGTRLEIALDNDISSQIILEVSFLKQGVGGGNRFLLLNK
jgi:hypothetical protein